MATPDKGIPEEVLSNAKCILVVPDLIKGGFIFGVKHGRGVASCRTAEGWSAPAFVSVGGGSWGLQIGVEGVDLVMLVMNDQGFQHLLSSKFALTGEVGKHERHVLLGKGKVRIKANSARRARCKAARQVGKRSASSLEKSLAAIKTMLEAQ